ncbi:MAG: delta-aminolevulinic acid dehydratase [Deltaproteobacteria bacterium RBG_13_65_10]|jgi:porphobilinogen synthase|nr:MAG: delta-aminolevulinic acid dehydratase [Deltaproteobacteria bacterium RBG_13_65_10]
MTPFPQERPRRLRRTPWIRDLVRETRLAPADLVQPLFVMPGEGMKQEVLSLPGQYRFSVDLLVKEAVEAQAEGIRAVILFGIPATKDPLGSESYADDGIVQRAVRSLKREAPDLGIVTDVCLCEYTDHGHCGKVVGREVDNDATLELLGKVALSHARAGADVVAPSDMMDGRVRFIREALDQQGFPHVAILAYAAKHASSYYGPFREAAHSSPLFGDRRSYQMDPANRREALRELKLDAEEGADILLVKPAMPCLDILRDARERFDLPLAAYQVSGEYAVIRAAAERGWVDGEAMMMESLTAIRRAGADIVITYFAREAARRLARG